MKRMKQRREQTALIFHRKLSLNNGLVNERMIWRVPTSERYPHGIRYRMVLVEPKNHEVIVLYDNHWPKGPHVHWYGRERPYEFVTIEELMRDFINESEVEEKRYHENKKD